MGLWASYFFAKGALHFAGYLHVSVWWNLLFAALLIAPTPDHWSRRRAVVVARSAIHVAIAIALLWHDSWLPPLSEAVRFVANGGLPTGTFVVEFLLDSINPWIVGAGIALVGITAVAGRYVRLTPLVLALLFIIGLQAWTTPKEAMDQKVKSFLAEESKRVVTFPAAGEQSPAFDIVFLHVCSLSWDDLREVGMENAEFFRQFDFLLTNFNSATSHSTNAVLRLLRSTCGQTAQEALYRKTNPDCYLFDVLRANGYSTSFAMNHSGEYMQLNQNVQDWGHAGTPIEIDALPIRAYDFDGSALRADYDVLEQWFRLREQSDAKRAVLLYNTITLHLGGQPVDVSERPRDNRARYALLVQTLFDELERFFSLLEASARHTVVVLIPEHGAAIRGTKFQASGLREIPFPSITTVPVGIRLIGPEWFTGAHPRQQVIDRPTSYLAITTLLADLMARSALAINDADARLMAEHIPPEDFVSENEGAIVIRDGGRYFMKHRAPHAQWTELPSEVVAVAPEIRAGQL